jgi:hypothetical protein
MTTSVFIDSATEDELEKDHFGDPYCGILKAGEYLIADPSIILDHTDYEEWHKVATISEVQFGQYGNGHDGILHSARINSHPVTGFTVYGDFAEYKDECGRTYESSSEENDHALLVVFPTDLLKELGVIYPEDHVFRLTEDDVEKERNAVHYSTRTHRMFVGPYIEIYTGHLDGAISEIEAENTRDEEMYAELLGYDFENN